MPDTSSLQPLEHAKESLLGLTIALEQRFGCQPRLDKETTLNTKFGVLPDRNPTAPRLVKYFCWGVGGRANDSPELSSAQFALGTNMALYKMRPFRVVPFEQDLSAEERANYAMRKIETIGGVPYCLYYLKKIDFTQSQVQYVRSDPVTGERQTYELDYSNLSPIAPTRGSNGVIEDVSDTVSVILPGLLNLTGEEVLESMSVMDGGDPRFAIASEIGMVSAATESVSQTDFAGNPFNYDEAVFAQLVDHYNWVGQPFLSTSDVYSKAIAFQIRNIING